MEFVGQPWDFEQKSALAASGRGSALHLSVTALSVKKALIVRLQVKKVKSAVMRHPHTCRKMRPLTEAGDCAAASVKE
jgi:hypothetical protein